MKSVLRRVYLVLRAAFITPIFQVGHAFGRPGNGIRYFSIKVRFEGSSGVSHPFIHLLVPRVKFRELTPRGPEVGHR